MKTVNKRLTVLLIAILSASSAWAQNSIADVISRIETNNTTLAARRETAQAEKLMARTGLAPANPEVEFGYMWGCPGTPGNRIDVSFSQSFDFPSVYVYKNRISKLAGFQADLNYNVVRYEILSAAYDLCVELTYLNAMNEILDDRVNRARKLNGFYQQMLASGQDNAVNSSKARMSMLSVEKQKAETELARKGLLEQLSALNGGTQIEFTQSVFSPIVLDDSFEYWFDRMSAQNPALAYLRSQIELAGAQVKLNSAEGLPRFAVGYKSEAVMRSDQFQGITASISIPLWENTNRVKAARAAVLAAKSEEEDSKLQFYHSLQATYQRVVSLAETISKYGYRQELIKNIDMLDKALSSGAISLLAYYTEIETTYGMIDSDLTTQRDLNLAYSALRKYDI